MAVISTRDPFAVAAAAAIHAGELDEVRRVLAERPELATARLGDDDPDGINRTLLHVATDWPGHFPRVAETVAVLVDHGADVDARFHGPHQETPLHWAASSNDTDALHALLDAGADIDADGGVIAGGTPLQDATAFGQWAAARALVARGARTTPFDLAALGHTDQVLATLDASTRSDDERQDTLDHAFWSACHGGQLATAQALARHGATVDWLPAWENATPLDIAARSAAYPVIEWLHTQRARTCDQLNDHD